MRAARRVALIGAGVALGLALTVPSGLRFAGRFLVVEDPSTRSDVLYVFPGSVPGRAACAASLFRKGLAPTIVVTGERVRPELTVVGLPLSDAEVNARVLSQHGVPDNAIVIRSEGTSTWEDVHALHRWVTTQPAISAVTAVTSPHHTRRARRTLRSVFEGTDITVHMQPCPATVAADWWRHEDTVLRVINEYIKLTYYVLAH